MSSETAILKSTVVCSAEAERLAGVLEKADAVLIGAGAGLSASAGLTYSGERFERLFSDFAEACGIRDMYSGGFHRFPTPEEHWGWWSRHVWHNRYEPGPLPVYRRLFSLVKDRDYFVLTSNVDHQFQLAGFDRQRLFYMQGDYGLWQCSVPCHERTYDNESVVRRMVREQKNRRVPSELVPHCPVCGRLMTMNLHADDTFVRDEGWFAAKARYREFLQSRKGCRMVFWELGVGFNTPGIIKYPFRQMTADNPSATYVCMNMERPQLPPSVEARSLWIPGDIGDRLAELEACLETGRKA